MSCFRKFIQCVLNERRVCRLLNIDPDQLHEPERKADQYILAAQPIIKFHERTLLFTQPGQLQFSMQVNFPCAVSVIFGASINDENINASATSIPQHFQPKPLNQLFTVNCKNVKKQITQGYILITALNQNDSVNFQMFEFQVTPELRISLEVAKIGAEYYELEKVFGAKQTPKTGEEFNEANCCICLDENPNIVALPCRHLILCKECAEGFRTKSTECPLCRQKIDILVDMGQGENDMV
ncbi:Zinc_finger domain-containing protein [Hexamita inflata]|uniref:Zinc_finger domain-containing protein n=1 Tax=Hexamita inflata TaxID=28002 RepID=A0ABP1HVD9_9EUKA